MSTAIIIGIVLVLLAILLYLYVAFTEPMQKFSVWTQWFDTYKVPGYGGDPPSCNWLTSGSEGVVNCVPQNQLANYLYGNNLEYWLGNLFNRTQFTLEQKWQVNFITSLMRTYAYGIVPDGFLLPAHLCCGITPRLMIDGRTPDVKDSSGKVTNRTFWNTCVNPVSNNTIYNTWSTLKGVKTYKGNNKQWVGKLLPNCYPGGKGGGDNWQANVENWRTFMASVWGFVIPTDADTNTDWFTKYAGPGLTGTGSCGTPSWYHPSNFLWNCYVIPWNSPLVLGYLTGAVNGPSGSWPPSKYFISAMLGTLLNDVPTGSRGVSVTGWIGLMQLYVSTDSQAAFLYQDIWMTTIAPSSLSGASGSKPNACSSTFKSGFSAGLGGAGVGAMIGAPVAPPVGALVGAAIGFLAGWFGTTIPQTVKQGSAAGCVIAVDCQDCKSTKKSDSALAAAGDGELLETILASSLATASASTGPNSCPGCDCCPQSTTYSASASPRNYLTYQKRIDPRSELIGV